MRVRGVDFLRAQRGWVCDVWFSVQTTNQFTDETHKARDGARFAPLAFWRAWRAARRLHGKLRASPRERAELGWR